MTQAIDRSVRVVLGVKIPLDGPFCIHYSLGMQGPQLNRRLSAILAADIVGYSRLMAQNEAATLAAVNDFRKSVFDPQIARYNGRIVKLMGDGTLVEFVSVVDAVDCARAIQESVAQRAGAESPFVLRIGINLGDIIIQDDDIFGDGVNIASRLEALAPPGGICVSSVVNENVENRLDLRFVDGGEVALKNIARKVRVFHWQPGAPGGNDSDAKAAQKPAKPVQNRSVAVLPFDNMSDDPEQEFFSDGISEDIITDLSKVPGLAVTARNSSFVYKGKAVDLRTVGKELGVSAVLEGSVRRAGQRVRINAQLIDTATGEHIWAERYDRDLTDIFAVQDEVTLEIVKALKIQLTPDARKTIAGVGTPDLAAHEEFMRMRSLLFYPGMATALWREAVDAGERALQRDPNYSDAYATLALFHVLDFHNHWSGRDPDTALAEAQTLTERALETGPDNRLANHASAVVHRWQGHLDQADALMRKAMPQGSEYALGLFTTGEIAIGRGQFTKAISDLENAIRLDPAFRHQTLQFLAMAHFLAGHIETAALMLRERVLLVTDTDIGRAWLVSALGHLGRIDEAQQVWADLMALNPDFAFRTRLERLAFTDPAHLERILDGVKKAGLGDQI